MSPFECVSSFPPLLVFSMTLVFLSAGTRLWLQALSMTLSLIQMFRTSAYLVCSYCVGIRSLFMKGYLCVTLYNVFTDLLTNIESSLNMHLTCTLIPIWKIHPVITLLPNIMTFNVASIDAKIIYLVKKPLKIFLKILRLI